MKNCLRKAIAAFLAFTVIMSALSVFAFAKTSEEADTHLQFGPDGKFTIMQISDLQDFFPMKSLTKKVLRKVLDENDVDLIVLTGDNISSTTLVKGYAALAINEFMSIINSRGIPTAMTFGNHDDENTTATKAFQVSVYEKYGCFVGCAGEDLGDNNLCTYYVPIYSSTDKNKMVSNVWMVDSCTYNVENDLGGYGCVTKAQVDWYKSTSEKLERENNGKIPSLMFQHIIVPEIWDALAECEPGTPGSVGHAGKSYTLPEGAKGILGETPCPPNYTNGQFDAVLERGDVMGMFFGHDHTNTFEIDYKGVKLINTAGIGFNSYNGEDEGVRLITIDENAPWSFETQAISYYDLFDKEDERNVNLFNIYSSTVDTKTAFLSIFKYIFSVIKYAFA